MKKKEKEMREVEYYSDENEYYSTDSYYSDDEQYIKKGKGKTHRDAKIPKEFFV